MNRYRLSWFRSHWKLRAGVFLLLGIGAAVSGILAWHRCTDADATTNPIANSAQNNLPFAKKKPAEAAAIKPKQVLSRYSLAVSTMAFSPDGLTLATAASGSRVPGEIRLWDLVTRREKRGSRFPGTVCSLAFSRDGKALTCAGEGPLAIPGNGGSATGAIELWEFAAVAKLVLWRKTERTVVSMVGSPQEDRLAAGCNDGRLTLYNRATKQPLLSLRGEPGLNPYTNLAFSSDGKKIAWGGVASSGNSPPRFQGILQVWDAIGGKLLATLHPPESRPNIPNMKSVAFLPGGDKLVSSSNQTIYIWDLKSGQLEASLSGHQGIIEALVLSPNGRLLASCDSYACIKLWDVSSRREKITLRRPTILVQGLSQSDVKQGRTVALAFDPDGEMLASSTLAWNGTGQEGGVELWDLVALKKVDLAH